MCLSSRKRRLWSLNVLPSEKKSKSLVRWGARERRKRRKMEQVSVWGGSLGLRGTARQPMDAKSKASSTLLRSQRSPHHSWAQTEGPCCLEPSLLFCIQVQSISSSRKALPELTTPFPPTDTLPGFKGSASMSPRGHSWGGPSPEPLERLEVWEPYTW